MGSTKWRKREASLRSLWWGCNRWWFLSRKRTKEANLTFARARVQRPSVQMPHLHASTVQVAMVSPSPLKLTSAGVMKPECSKMSITCCAALRPPQLYCRMAFFGFFYWKNLVAGDSGRCLKSQRELSLLSRCYDSHSNFSRYWYGKTPAICSTTATYSGILLLWLFYWMLETFRCHVRVDAWLYCCLSCWP